MAPHEIVAVFVCLVAGGSDIRTHRIPNWLTFGAAAGGMAYRAWADGAGAGLNSLGGLLAGLALFFPFFALGGLGGGDVKLLAALGAWLGLPAILWVAFYAALGGGVLAVVAAVRHGLLASSLRNVWLMLMYWRVAGPRPVDGLTLQTAAGPRLPYSIPIGIGVFLSIWLS